MATLFTTLPGNHADNTLGLKRKDMDMDQRYLEVFNKTISHLGFGGMRFPTNEDGSVNMEEAVAMLRKAYELGVNYFDTAVVYHKGESEQVFAKAFAPYDRSTYYIADKMSIWLCKTEEEMKALFEKQLQTLGTDYIDFYLVHSLTTDHYAQVKKLHCVEFLQEMKAAGKIKHLGFSFHDTLPVLRQILDDYKWDFAQLQLNYLDWINQHADHLYKELEKRQIPCIVMEPVRGGYLANLDEKRSAPFKQAHPDASLASWAFRWVASLPNVAVVLSGMTTMEQLLDNVNTFTDFAPLNSAEQAAIDAVVEEIQKLNDIPCTGCRYCMECPQGVDIPALFSLYGEFKVYGRPRNFVAEYDHAIEKGFSAEKCVECGACALHCPQSISIPERLKGVHDLYLAEKEKLAAAK